MQNNKIAYAGKVQDFKLWLKWLAHYSKDKTLVEFNNWLADKPARLKLLEAPF